MATARRLIGNIRGPQGAQGIQGEQGIQGPTGATGATGPAGPMPVLSAGTVTDLPAGSDPTFELTGTSENPVMNLGIPHGRSGNETIDDTAGEGDVDLVWSADKLVAEKKILQNDIDQKATAIYADIDYIPIASFADGADDMPVKDLKVAIEPVQDLHGYDHPWPGGVVLNLIPDGTDTSNGYEANKYLTSDGAVVSNDDFYISEYFAVEPSTVYTLSKTPSMSSNAPSICFYDFDKTYISGVAVNQQNEQQITTPADAAYARCTQRKYMTGGFYQFELGNTATELMPYSNVCPITGFAGAHISRVGKNLLEPSTALLNPDGYTQGGVTLMYQDDGRIKITGTATANSIFRLSYLKRIIAQNEQVRPGCLIIGKRYRMTGYNSKYVLQIANPQWATVPQAGLTFTCKYATTQEIRLTTKSGETYDDVVEIMVSDDLDDDTWEPYLGTTYPIAFPSSAGTVYGGTLDVVSGKLVVDRKSIDLGSLTWSKSTYVGGQQVFQGAGADSGSLSQSLRDGMCSCYKYDFNAMYAGTDKTISFIDNGLVYVRDYSYDDKDVFKTAVTGQQLVFKVATPITYTLTPAEIRTLLGTNNIWADAGDVSVTYPADAKTYIDNRISNTRKLITGIETGFTASKAYAVGEMLIVENDLYKVIATIASGATITVGTNVTKTTVAEQLAVVDDAVAQTEEDVADLKSAISGVESALEFELITPDSTENSWRLKSSGLAAQNSNYRFIKYKVEAGQKIYLKANTNPIDDSAAFQFQSSSSVSSTNNPYIIGNPYLYGFNGVIEVPTGATYLIISALKTDAESGLYNVGKLDEINKLDEIYLLSNESKNIDDFLHNALRTETPIVNTSGYDLVPETGLSKVDEGYRIKKYNLSSIGADKQIYVVSDHYFQFQNNVGVPSSGESNRIGSTYGEFSGFVKIPVGATHIVISTDADDGIGNVYIDNIGSDIVWWNSGTGGIKINGDDLIIDTNGFSLYHNGYIYYIAPTDKTTVTTFTGSGRNKFLLLDTANLGTPGRRTNPSDVLFVIAVNNNALIVPETCIPVACWYDDYWKFIGAFEFFNRGGGSGTASARHPVTKYLSENHLVSHAANSIAKIETAIGNGYKIIEMDVLFTSDNIPVLAHDATFTVGGVTYTIAEETYETLVTVKPDLAMLKDGLILCKQKNVVPDIDYTKSTYTDAQNAVIVAIVKSLGINGRCFFTAVANTVRKLINIEPDLCVAVSAVSSTDAVDGLADIAETATVTICTRDYRYITQEFVEYVHSHGMLVKAWTIDTVSDIETMYGYGIDMIISNTVKPSDIDEE